MTPAWCPIHQHHKWCEHNGGRKGPTGYESPEHSDACKAVYAAACDGLPHKTDALPPMRIAHTHVELRDGSPFVRGTLVPVRRLWSWNQRGVSVEVLIKRYPQMGAAKVLDALAFAHDNVELVEADLAREQRLLDP